MEFDNCIETNRTAPVNFQTSSLRQPGLLVAYSVDTKDCSNGRIPLMLPAVVGRSARDAQLQIRDTTLSQQHFQIRFDNSRFLLNDLDSTNGTFINGLKVKGTSILEDGDMIRAGESLLVFTEKIKPFLTMHDNCYNLKGRYYSSVFLEKLKDAVSQNRHILLSGPPGSGKELAARAISQLKNKPMLTYNAASSSSVEEAVTTLQGVESHVFSGVAARSGLIEQAKDGILFIDEIHNYPIHVQRALLRILEDGRYTRTGGERPLKCNASFIFASNEEGPTHGLAKDFWGRLRKVSLPDLHKRRADIPELFNYFFTAELKRLSMKPEKVLSSFTAKHYEVICMEDFRKDNIRGLIDVSLMIAKYIKKGETPEEAMVEALNARKMSQPGTNNRMETHNDQNSFDASEATSFRKIDTLTQPLNSCADTIPQNFAQIVKYSTEVQGCPGNYREQIWDVYIKNGGNISAVCRALKSMGIETSDKTLKKYIKRWEFPSKKDLRGC